MNKNEIYRQRKAQKLMSRELAQRMGVSPARISVLERDELRGAVTLKMMARAAAALGCEFVYELVPVKSLPHQSSATQTKPRLRLQHNEQLDILDGRMREALDKNQT